MRILIAHNLALSAQAWRTAIAARLPESTVGVWPETLEGPADYAIGWQAPRALFDRERRLKAFFVAGAGVDQMLAFDGLDPGLPIVRLEDAGMARQIARYCLAEVLGWCGHRDTYDRQQREQVWNARPRAVLSEWPIVIFGLGRLGSTSRACSPRMPFLYMDLHAAQKRSITFAPTWMRKGPTRHWQNFCAPSAC